MTIDPKTVATTPPIDFSFLLVSPSEAESLLKNNAHNRAIAPTVVARYVADIEADQWALTHQAIALGPDMQIVDGQHRLTAIVKAGKSVRVVMAIYRDEKMAMEARQKVDLGRVRRGGDVMEIGGITEKGDGKRVFAITSAIMALGSSTWGGFTPAAVTSRYLREQAGVDFAAELPSKAFIAPIAAAFAYAHPIAPAKVEGFAGAVRDKVGIVSGSPEHIYVRAQDEGLLGTTSSKAARTDSTLRVLRLLMAHVTGEANMGKLQISPKGYEWARAERIKLGVEEAAPAPPPRQSPNTPGLRRPARTAGA